MSTETETDVESTEIHAVLYTDGGCRPTSRGQAGWGMHGYLYSPVPAKTGAGSKEVPTKMGYDPTAEGRPEITLLRYVDGFGALPGVSTNNAAEVTAFMRALELMMREHVKRLLVLTDSMYTINGFNSWMHGWCKRNWKDQQGQPIANQEQWMRIYELAQELKQMGAVVTTKHVKGHSGLMGNELADKLATAGVMSGFNNVFDEVLELTDAKGYWSTSREYNRLLGHPFRYFSTQSHVATHAPDGRHIYYTGKMKRDDLEMIGKKISDSSLAIVYLKEPEPVLEMVGDCMREMGAGTYQGMLIADMASILNPKQYESLSQFGTRLLVKNITRGRLVDGPTDTVLCEEAKPPFLSFRLAETLGAMEQYFQHYLSGRKEFITTTDITDILYETVMVGKGPKAKPTVRLKPSINPGARTIPVKANYIRADDQLGVLDLTLTMDQDVPDRNTLSALAAPDVRVTLVTWAESGAAIRFATVFEVNGDAAFWAGAYANLKIVAT